MAKKTIAEQIQAFEATRQAKAARMTELMDTAAEKNETLDEAAREEYDNLEADVKSVDEHLVRLRKMEAANKAAAIPVQGSSVELATQSRGAVSVQMKPNRPPGIGFARIALAKMAAFKNSRDPMLCAQELWPSDPDIADYFKTAVVTGTTVLSGWASQLVVSQNMPSEFVEWLRPQTILGRIPGFRQVPFNITVPRQTAGASATWVGESKAKPLSRPTFDSISLTHTKLAVISVFSEELARFSNPSVETLVRDDLGNAISQYLDAWFFDPSQAGTANVSPASITYGVDTDVAQGTAIGDLDEDLREAFANFQAAEVGLDGVVICMQPQQATAIGMMKNPLGQQAFPNINGTGGTLYGLPVYTSTNVGSGRIVLFKPSECLLADDGGVNVAVSNQASLQMDDDPTAGAQTLVSLFQTDRIAVRVERYINFKMRRADAVYYISSSDFGAYTTA